MGVNRCAFAGFTIIALVMVSNAVHAVFFFEERFEDDTVGTAPQGDFYTFSKGGTNPPSVNCLVDNSVSQIEPGSTKLFRMNLGGTAGTTCLFTLDVPIVAENMEFYLHRAGGSTGDRFGFNIRSDTGLIQDFFIEPASGGPNGHLVRAKSPTLELLFNGACTTALDGLLKWEMSLDWTAKTMDITWLRADTEAVCGSITGRPFVTSSSTSMTVLEMELTLGDENADVRFDGWYIDTTVSPPTNETSSPSEFDTGLTNFIAGIGFRTPESQMFFSFALVGIATVSSGVAIRFMTPSRLKNVVVATPGILLGSFFVLLTYVEFWMYVVAAVLAGVILQGAKEVRNTYREIQAAIREGAGTTTQPVPSQEAATAETAATEPETTQAASEGDESTPSEEAPVEAEAPTTEPPTEAEPEATEDGEQPGDENA